MKPALYFGLRRGWNHGLGYRPVAVTSEKGSRWYGRDLEYNEATNGRLSELVGRFETEEVCKGKMQGVKDIHAIYQPQIDELEKQRKRINKEWGDANRAFLGDA
jgi:hypothetical protein